jgi:hypothetical protein
MNFTARLTPDHAQVEAGGTAPFTIEVVNRSETVEHFEIRIEGLDADWCAVPVPTFAVDAGDQGAEKFFLKPPRTSESLAGSYPFVVKVRSLDSGEETHTQGVLEIKPFHHISLDASPRRTAVSPYKKQATFQVTVMNLGNVDHTLQLHAADSDDAFAYEFSQDQISVGPGQQKVVELYAGSSRRALLASTRLHAVAISARSISVPTVVGTTQAQLEQRALISPGPFFMVLALAALAAGWYAFLPKPPSMDALITDRSVVTVGTPVRISWRASQARAVIVRIGNATTLSDQPTVGAYDFVPEKAGPLEISAVALMGEKRSRELVTTVNVVEKQPAPAPKILSFDISPRTLKLGETFLVKYSFNDAVERATLSPPGMTLDTKIDSITLTADLVGDLTYKLVAENADGETDVRSIKVKVVEGSEAAIVVFTANPTTVSPTDGRVTLTWQLTKAVRVEISDGQTTEQVDADRGSKEYTISKDTTFTLTGYDSNGRTISRQVKVRMAQAPPAETSGDQGGSTSAGGG